MFGKITDQKVILNQYGKIVHRTWNDLPDHYNVILDEFVIMPDHVHGIIFIINGLNLNELHCGIFGLLDAKSKFNIQERNGLRPLCF